MNDKSKKLKAQREADKQAAIAYARLIDAKSKEAKKQQHECHTCKQVFKTYNQLALHIVSDCQN